MLFYNLDGDREESAAAPDQVKFHEQVRQQ